ncbi:MAG: MraY family glycosyltransferase [candidate division WOR-3 bacterium]
MNPTLALSFGSAAASLTLNSWLRDLARRRKWCDPVDGESRGIKIHLQPTPFTGGIAIGAVFVTGLALSAWWLEPQVCSTKTWAIGAVAALALAVGSWDDFRWKHKSVPLPKFALQVTAAALTGYCLRSPLPALFVLGAMNAYNLSDGIDGLAGGEAASSALALGLVFTNSGQRELGAAALILAGAVAGFLVLNWHPAQVFLGDGGSHLVGATLAAMAYVAGGIRPGPTGLVATLLLLGLPVIDAAWTVGCRLVERRPLFAGDRNHLYDLARRLLSVRQTVIAMLVVHSGLVSIGAALLCRKT